MFVFEIIQLKFISKFQRSVNFVVIWYLPTNMSELSLFLEIVNFYVRSLPYLLIVQTTWEGAPVALDETVAKLSEWWRTSLHQMRNLLIMF